MKEVTIIFTLLAVVITAVVANKLGRKKGESDLTNRVHDLKKMSDVMLENDLISIDKSYESESVKEMLKIEALERSTQREEEILKLFVLF